MNRIQRDGLCLDSKTGEHKLILSIQLILSELCLDSEAGDPDSQKETKETKAAAGLIPKQVGQTLRCLRYLL